MANYEAAHAPVGTQYGIEGATAYAIARHGPDGAKFLDPYLLLHLNDLNGLRIVDIGTGAGPWAIWTAQQGAETVCALDYQWNMVTQARKLAKEGGLPSIHVDQADAAALPYPPESFDLALSINVGCNLPSTTKIDGRSVGFFPHFDEMGRVLKPGVRAIITAPTSFCVVFTSGIRTKPEELTDIKVALATIGDSNDAATIRNALNKLSGVYRATFARRGNEWRLIQSEEQLLPGEEIWRKLPGVTVPNRYHPEREYEEAFGRAGLEILHAYRESLDSEEERARHNEKAEPEKQLGPEYVGNPPFVLWVVKKEEQV